MFPTKPARGRWQVRCSRRGLAKRGLANFAPPAPCLPHQKPPVCPPTEYAATSVKPTAPSKTSAEITGRLSSPARRLCPNPVHATTAGKFKLTHYRFGHDHQLVDDVIGYCCAQGPTQGWPREVIMSEEHTDNLKKARAKLIEQRRAFVKVLAGPYERGKTEQAREKFLEMQTAIEAMNPG